MEQLSLFDFEDGEVGITPDIAVPADLREELKRAMAWALIAVYTAEDADNEQGMQA